MQDTPSGSYDPGVVETPPVVGDRVVAETTTLRATTVPVARARVLEEVVAGPDRARWGPILAGIAAAIASLLVLNVFGLAVGWSAMKPGADVTDYGTAAGLWSAFSIIVSFLIGGWVASDSSAVVGLGTGILNGVVTGAACLTLITFMTAIALTNLVGGIGTILDDIARVVIGGTGAAGAVANAKTYSVVKDAAWGTFFALALALIAAGVGGLIGYYQRRDLIDARP